MITQIDRSVLCSMCRDYLVKAEILSDKEQIKECILKAQQIINTLAKEFVET